MSPYIPFLGLLALAGLEGAGDRILSAAWFARRPVLNRSGAILLLVLAAWTGAYAWGNRKFSDEIYLRRN